MRVRPSLAALSLVLAISGVAAAQNVSDADRKAARDLYETGASLQVEGKPAEALDAFMRSYAVYPAPTTALHVAQCQAALGHLVESEESYRALSNAQIPPGSPPAFFTAQDQARQELAQVAPRVPTIRVTTPDKVPGLVVKIDDVALNSALVGVPRPVNPGMHKIAATAPNATPVAQTITVQEREARDVPLAIRVLAGPPMAGPPVVQVEPTGGWNAPYVVPTRRANKGLYGGGIALVVVGSIATVFGGLILLVSVGHSDTLLVPGIGTTGFGIASIVGGSIMISVGGKRVPITDAVWMPKVQVGSTNTLTWSF